MSAHDESMLRDALHEAIEGRKAAEDRVRVLETALRDASELAHAASMAPLDDKARAAALRLARRIDAALTPAPPANPHIGSSLTDFLVEEGIKDEVDAMSKPAETPAPTCDCNGTGQWWDSIRQRYQDCPCGKASGIVTGPCMGCGIVVDDEGNDGETWCIGCWPSEKARRAEAEIDRLRAELADEKKRSLEVIEALRGDVMDMGGKLAAANEQVAHWKKASIDIADAARVDRERWAEMVAVCEAVSVFRGAGDREGWNQIVDAMAKVDARRKPAANALCGRCGMPYDAHDLESMPPKHRNCVGFVDARRGAE